MISSLVARMVLLVSVAILLLVAITSYIHHKEYSELLSKRIVEAIQQDLRAGSTRFEQEAETHRRYLKFLFSSADIKSIEGAGEAYEPALIEKFTHFIISRPEMLQIHFIPEESLSLPPVFVSRDSDKLLSGNKSQYWPYDLGVYRAQVARVAMDEVVNSEIEVQRDREGTPKTPQTLSVQFTTPIFGQDGSRLGVLGTVMNVTVIFSREQSALSHLNSYLPGSRSYITNAQGDYVLHPEPVKAMNHVLGGRSNVVDDWPEIALLLSDLSRTSFYFFSDDGDSVVLVDRVNIGTEKHPSYLFTILNAPLDSVFSELYQLQATILLFTLICLVLVVLVCAGYISGKLKPLQDLVQRIRSYSPSQPFEPVEVTGENEIGEVSASFNALAQQMSELFVQESSLKEGLNKFTLLTSMDLDGTLLEVNTKFSEVTGYTDKEVVGTSVSLYRSGVHDEKYYQDLWGALSQGKIWRDDMSHTAKDGKIIWLDTSIVPLLDSKGEIFRLLNIQVDITERHLLLDELQKARKKAEHASRVKSDFLASMSHELRTPLNSIIGFSERLKRKLQEQISPRHMDAVETIERNGQHLLQVINEILDVAKIESGRMVVHPEQFELNRLVRDVQQTMSTQAKAKHLSLSCELPDFDVLVFLDRKKLIQTLLNLLSNAIKYTNVGGVVIRLENDSEWLHIAIEDTGIGIKQDDIPKLFTRFTQLETSITQRVEGTGLGLVLAGEFVSMQGGKISVESEFNEGSIFTVSLPKRLDLESLKDKTLAL